MIRLFPAILLTGCSLMIGNYDANEYAYVNHIRTLAQVSGCSKPEVYQLYISALTLKNYSELLPDNDQEIELVNDLYKVVNQLYTFDSPSPAYCKAKMNIIESIATRIGQVTASKPR